MCIRQFQHIRNVLYAFEKKYEFPFVNIIQSNFFGNVEKNLLILGINKIKYY